MAARVPRGKQPELSALHWDKKVICLSNLNVARDLLSCFEPDGPKRVTDVITRDETWVPANAGTKHGWVQTTRDTKSVSPDFRAGGGCLPPSSTRGLWQLMFCLLTTPPQVHIMQKQFFCPKSSKRSAASVQSPPPRTSSFSATTMPVPTKPGL